MREDSRNGVAAGDWPAISLAEAEARLCAPGALFEYEDVTIDGIAVKCWKNQPRDLAALARLARDQYAERPFLIFEDERVSYDAWFRATAVLAQALAALGIEKGDRVAIAMRNLPEWPVAFFAAASLGAIVVPLNAWWSGPELRYGLEDSGAKALICDSERWRLVEPERQKLLDLQHILVARADQEAEGASSLESIIGTPADYAALAQCELPTVSLDPDDDATIFYTSGTTGSPKGALGTHRNILVCTLAYAYAIHRAALLRGEEPAPASPKTNLVAIPFFHVTACNSVLMATMQAGGTLVLMRKWDALEAMTLIERERVTNSGGVPTIAWQLLEHPERHRFDLSSLETISYGGAPSATELVRRLHADMHVVPANGWGMTETSATVTNLSAEEYLRHPDSCGLALPVSRLRIMDADGNEELPVGSVGELWASGPQVVRGYWRNPEATRATFHQGWVRTGDLARLDEEGFCYIVDRAKDIIIRGGENIYSSEVEDILYEHPAVVDAAVVGLPHRTLGEEPAAVVHLVADGKASEAELQDWVRERTARFKVPVRILFLSGTLPRNANGKILKKDLKRLF